jgi:E3 ubiquitin-protein ligase TRIP12
MAAAAFRRPSSHVDPQDANILRARVIRFKYLSEAAMEGASDAGVGNTFVKLRTVVARLSSLDASEAEARDSLKMIAELFSTRDASLSSFELIKSGLVGELLFFATGSVDKASVLLFVAEFL